MADLIDRERVKSALEHITNLTWEQLKIMYPMFCVIDNLPPAQPDTRLKKIADLVEGSIDHFDRDDAMDLLYQIKGVLNGRVN